MTRKTFFFDKKRPEDYGEKTRDMLLVIQSAIDLEKDCLVILERFSEGRSKSYKQLRGFHRLVDIMVDYFSDWTGDIWDRGGVKDIIKIRSGFVRKFGDIKVTKSCRDATLKEMNILIAEVIKFADELGIENFHLRGYEEKELIEFYSK